jgi:hypothetical protein
VSTTGGTIDTEHDGEERTETPGLVAIVALDGTVERLSQTWEVELVHRPDLEQLKPLAGADEQVVARFDARVPRFDGSLRLYRWSARLVEGRIGTAPGRQALYVRGEAAEGDDFSLAEALTSRVVGILSPPRE